MNYNNFTEKVHKILYNDKLNYQEKGIILDSILYEIINKIELRCKRGKKLIEKYLESKNNKETFKQDCFEFLTKEYYKNSIRYKEEFKILAKAKIEIAKELDQYELAAEINNTLKELN